MRTTVLIGIGVAWNSSGMGRRRTQRCDKFKWNIDHERTALTAPDRMKLASGANLTSLPSTGVTLALQAPAEAKLPPPPERAPKDGTFAAFATFKTAPKAGLYTVSLSAGGWVDLVQDGHALKPKALAPPPTATASARP